MVKPSKKKSSHITLKKFTNDKLEDPFQLIINAANEGCLLQQLYIEEHISEELFHAGLAFAKLYSLSMRSFGIHNRIRTASQTWDQLHGKIYDHFSSRKIEGIWRYILKSLDPIYHQGIPMRQVAFKLVLIDQITSIHTIDQIRKTLTYLLEIWQKIESSPYRLGLFNFKEKPCHSRLN